ncbi:MAG: glucose 1-dehydrogenase [Candidatus Tectomicrobia bacterium]|nr:glucose 1-dehydrogenase [Candidatus Tectomicrobia bacterium]
MRLKGKVGFITGGARGIGGTTARVFAREGARVVIADLLDQDGERLVHELKEGGAEAIFVHLDVTRDEEWQQAIAEAVRVFGRLDILVNNAGIGGRRVEGQSDLENWNRVMVVNSTGVFLGVKAVVESMKQAGGGSIINISSIYGLVGPARAAEQPVEQGLAGAYNASKGAVRLLTKTSALQLGKYNIRVNSVHPGFIETPMTAYFLSDPEQREYYRRLHPIGRLGKPEDIANAILYLASDESSFVTGSELVVDGGYTAQ